MVPLPPITPIQQPNAGLAMQTAVGGINQLAAGADAIYNGIKSQDTRNALINQIQQAAPYIKLTGQESLPQLATGLQQLNQFDLAYEEAKAAGASLPQKETAANIAFNAQPAYVSTLVSSLNKAHDAAKGAAAISGAASQVQSDNEADTENENGPSQEDLDTALSANPDYAIATPAQQKLAEGMYPSMADYSKSAYYDAMSKNRTAMAGAAQTKADAAMVTAKAKGTQVGNNTKSLDIQNQRLMLNMAQQRDIIHQKVASLINAKNKVKANNGTPEQDDAYQAEINQALSDATQLNNKLKSFSKQTGISIPPTVDEGAAPQSPVGYNGPLSAPATPEATGAPPNAKDPLGLNQ